jgi:Spy/CpxP family protein refolding chaperone
LLGSAKERPHQWSSRAENLKSSPRKRDHYKLILMKMNKTQNNGMKFTPTTLNRTLIKTALVATLVATTTLAGMAQNPPADPTHAQHKQATAAGESSLANQLAELRTKVARLEAALGGPHVQQPAGSPMPGMAPGSSQMNMGAAPSQSMGAGGGATAMGGMGMKKMMPGMMGTGGMSGMQSGTASTSGMNMPAQGGAMSDMNNMGDMMGMMMDMKKMKGMEKMKMMGMMGGMKGMNMPSALPGFPGASHLYHIGATGYFLDHPEHITLSTEQQVALNRVKEQAELGQASLERKIEESDQELWVLTSSDQPDAGKIEAKIREVEKLRGDQRFAFIRSVGDAAKVLTEEQRRVLTGLAEPQSGSAPAAHQHPSPPGK